jgi:hypothetical protein
MDNFDLRKYLVENRQQTNELFGAGKNSKKPAERYTLKAGVTDENGSFDMKNQEEVGSIEKALDRIKYLKGLNKGFNSFTIVQIPEPQDEKQI